MRYYIIFGVTFILLLIILFYNPYLGIYDDKLTIDYNSIDQEDGYKWEYSINNDNLVLTNSDESKWSFKPNKNGTVDVVFKYISEEKCKYTIEYKFKVKGRKIYWIKGEGHGLIDFPNPI